MNMTNKLKIKICLMLSIVALVSGCWGPPWPQRTVVINLLNAGATYADVQKFADMYLISHQFTLMGKAGYDEIKGTRTIYDYQGPDGIMASFGPEGTRDITRCKDVSISFNQNRKIFTPKAGRMFDALVKTLEERWPGAVKEKPRRVDSPAGSPH